ncbi:hypothetical protein SVAN01_06555 [Stagonosporopsis vannaccii]|nr:hypothetical protein SVAN01_06555 [Stagonosporopsis vannaccii]
MYKRNLDTRRTAKGAAWGGGGGRGALVGRTQGRHASSGCSSSSDSLRLCAGGGVQPCCVVENLGELAPAATARPRCADWPRPSMLAGDCGLLALHARLQPIRAPCQRADVTHQRGQRGSHACFEPGPPAAASSAGRVLDETLSKALHAGARGVTKSTTAHCLLFTRYGALHFLAIMAPTTARARPHAACKATQPIAARSQTTSETCQSLTQPAARPLSPPRNC